MATRVRSVQGAGVAADVLTSFLSSLEDVETSACGYGELKSATITTEDNGHLVTGTYEDRQWTVTVVPS